MNWIRRFIGYFRRRAPRALPHSGIIPLTGSSGTRYGTRAVLRAHENNGYLQSLVQLIADQVSQVLWTASKAMGDDGEVTGMPGVAGAGWEPRQRALRRMRAADGVLDFADHEVLRLLASPGPETSGRQMVWLVAAHLLLVGESFLWMVRDEVGRVVRLVVLPPPAVQQIPHRGSDTYQVVYEGISLRIPRSDVVHVKRPDPAEPLGRGVGLGLGVGDEIDSIEHVSTTIRSIYGRGGVPSVVVGIEQGQGMDDPAAPSKLEKKILDSHAGPENAGKMLVTNGKVTVAGVPVSLKDLDAAAIHQQLTVYLRQVYRVPPELMADIGSASRATSEAAKYHLAEFVVFPLLGLIRDQLQHQLVPQVDADLLLDFEDPRPTAADRIQLFMTNATTAPAFSLNEVREFVGYVPEASLDGLRVLPPPGSKPVEESAGADPVPLRALPRG